MRVLSALDLQKGAKAERNRATTLTQPIQFLSSKEKDQEWCAWNIDWIEYQGLKQLKRNARRLLKNYKLAKGIIDKTDYIVEEDNEYREILDYLTQEDESALELKFYPIIPNVINVLTNEFAKRNTTITFRTVDEYSYNEMLEQKKAQVEEVLLAQAQQKVLHKLIEAGMDLEGEEAQEALAPESLKSLPEIEDFFRKKYRNIPEQWASHQKAVDDERFKMNELEETAFREMLITDREFWHFRMMEDDYELELWNPVLTFYHKSPNVRYISQGNYVGKIDMLSTADVIDVHGWKMTEEQLKSLEYVFPAKSADYIIGGNAKDQMYDASRGDDWNRTGPSLGMRQYMSFMDTVGGGGDDIVNFILSESEDFLDFGRDNLLRCTTLYWKTQRRVGHLTAIDDAGEVYIDTVDENYKITTKPLYDQSLWKEKSKRNLIYGEHIDWIWINEVWGGVKIGLAAPGVLRQGDASGFEPIYLGINQNKVGRVKFQFKGDHTLYGCKLPVEGSVFSDKNTRSTALVDLMKPYQIAYNIVNNQIADILVDELGTVIMLDQNTLPQHSLGEDWGKGNLAKAYVAMKNFQMLPLDTSITNTENALNFQHFQPLNLEQTNRLMSRVQLANYFKQQAFEVIGLNPQRMGQQISQIDSARQVEQSLNASYAQTEMYFIQHSDYLMPRVHQMRTDLAQYYHSTKPSTRLQYLTSADEKVNFQLEGTSLLLRDINVFASTTANHRAILERLKEMMVQNNTTGASIYDLGRVMQAETMAQLNNVLKAAEEKMNQARQEDGAAQQDMQQAELEAKMQLEREKMEWQAAENEKNREKDVLVAEIRAAGYGAMHDKDGNEQNDFIDYMKDLKKGEQYQETMNFNREKESNRQAEAREKMNIEREKVAAQREAKEKDLQIAKENKTQHELKAAGKLAKEKKKK
jgi:hypothetical protein